MRKRAWACAAVVLAAAQMGAGPGTSRRGPVQQQELSEAAARQVIMAAEDARLDLPDDLHTPATDAIRARKVEAIGTLLALTRSREEATQLRAIRALGRYERRELITDLLPFLTPPPLRAETANALAQAFRGDPLPGDTSGQQVQGVFEALVQIGETDNSPALGAISRSVGRLPYVRAAQVQAADAFLLAAMRRVEPDARRRVILTDITRGVESLVRLHGKLASLSPDSIDWLRRCATALGRACPGEARVNALAALVAARAMDEDTLRRVAGDANVADLRRLAAISLGGAGATVVPAERTDLLSTLLRDPSEHVRLEALRAWARQETAANGCGRLLEALKDDRLSIVLAATDLLGDQCPEDQNVTDRLTAEARTPPPGEWHAESHALVALAKRASSRVFIPLLGSHISHPTWQVRMYAARAAAITNEADALARLALDPDDNVREATLAALKRLKKDEAEPYFLAALARDDYQLLRTAAIELKGLSPTPALAAALADAVTRVTLERKETSRDTRVALLDRLKEFGSPDQAGALVPLLRDFDVPVAMLAGAILQQWTGKPQEIAPQLLPRPPLPSAIELAEAADSEKKVRIELKSGKLLSIALMPESAPLTSVRFLKLVKSGYYDGLTFHRVVPNFVIQGGSPGANEYTGAPSYMHDEISLAANTARTVGLSTRGRDTGDGQFFVNLVDNPRLDFEYTVFGDISGDVDGVVEGEVIAKVTFEKLSPEDKKKERDPSPPTRMLHSSHPQVLEGAMDPMRMCGRCGGEMSAAGSLHSAVRVSFRPQDSKFMTLETGDIMTKAVMCSDCGLIEIVGDVNKLRRLTGGAAKSPNPSESTEPA